MTLKELYDVSPWAAIFVVQRDKGSMHIKARWGGEYKGAPEIANFAVKRIHATRYPMYASVLEVELEDRT